MIKFQSINPYNEVQMFQTEYLTPEALNIKLDIAWEAYRSHEGTTIEYRLSLVQKLKDRMLEIKQELASLITKEMGKPIGESLSEIEKCIQLCTYYINYASAFLDSYHIDNHDLICRVDYKPIGVVLGVMPWNFPFWQVFRFAIPTIIVGNTVLLKHAPNVPLCALEIERLFIKTGFPLGSYQNVFASEDQVQIILTDKRVKGVSLTGSERAGKAVASLAGGNLKRQVLELGGSDPFIVMPSANMEEVVKWAVKSRLINNGQSCIAAKRFIIHEAVYDDFLNALKKALGQLIIGDPSDTRVNIGPMARRDLLEVLKQQVERSVEQGAVIETRVSYAKEHPLFAPIIILSNIKKGMPAYDEELFGPVFSLFKISSLDEAILLANDTRYGLGASIWTSDAEEQRQGEERIEAGSVFVNAMVRSDPSIPFGGINSSGYGRELAMEGLREFCNVKTIVMSK